MYDLFILDFTSLTCGGEWDVIITTGFSERRYRKCCIASYSKDPIAPSSNPCVVIMW